MVAANVKVTPVVVETLEEQLDRLLKENAEMAAKISAIPAAGEFKLSVTVERKPGTRLKADGTADASDKGSKGGSLAISLGKSHIYPSKAMVIAIFDHEKEIKAFMVKNAAALTR